MNIILFHGSEVEHPLALNDPRAAHILGVLRIKTGQTFDAGLINGPLGKGTLKAINPDSLTLAFAWGNLPPPLYPIHLLIGLPRPQTSRDVLRDATTLGVASIRFFPSSRSESSYASSNLWKSEAWENCVIKGATQAFCTRLPEVVHARPLSKSIEDLPSGASRVALDNYEATGPLSSFAPIPSRPVVLALGAERGWAAEERTLLRQSGFEFYHLGSRVLRVETACIAAISLIKAKLGLS